MKLLRKLGRTLLGCVGMTLVFFVIISISDLLKGELPSVGSLEFIGAIVGIAAVILLLIDGFRYLFKQSKASKDSRS